MSEQVISREQYRLGTSLPLDRLLSFFFANPGFVLSNVSAMLSLQVFIMFLVFIGALANNLQSCPRYDLLGDKTWNTTQIEVNPPFPGCAVMWPVYDWENRIVLTL